MRWCFILLLLTGCQWDALVRAPESKPAKVCTWTAYSTRSVTVTSGDSTWVARDTIWLGTVPIECPKER